MNYSIYDLEQKLSEIADHQTTTFEQRINLIKNQLKTSTAEELKSRKTFKKEAYFNKNQDIVVVIDNKMPYTADKESIPAHSHDFFEMFYVYRGYCYSTIEGEMHKFNEGWLCLYSLQALHNIEISTEDTVIFNILIHPDLMKQTFLAMLSDNSLITRFFVNSIQNKELEIPYFLFNCNDNGTIDFYIKNIIVEYYSDQQSQQSQKYLQILLLGLLSQLSTNYLDQFSMPNTKEADAKQIEGYIRNHCADITLSHLAEQFHYSERGMIYQIYKLTGKKFSDLLRQAKIEAIKNQLVHSEYAIGNIIENVGYSNNRAMKIFKEETGMTMSQYRKVHKKQK